MIQKLIIDIPTIEQFYRIEEDGAVFSLTRNRYLSSVPNRAGYLHVCLHLYKANTFFLVHRLVASKYIGQCPLKQETSHKDGNKLNNHYSNLEYLTHSQNILKSFRQHGRTGYWLGLQRPPLSYEAKQLMSNAKKKPVSYTLNGHNSIYDSIETAAKELNTYRKKIYNCITQDKPLLGGWFSFIE
jgi:hypothetical protein